jgi:hypothetical protein
LTLEGVRTTGDAERSEPDDETKTADESSVAYHTMDAGWAGRPREEKRGVFFGDELYGALFWGAPKLLSKKKTEGRR